MSSPRRRARQAGFTLVELMISLVLFAFLVAGVLSVAVSMARAFREQRMTIGIESTGRSAMEFLSEALRGASPGVPAGTLENFHTCELGGFELTDNTTTPDSLRIAFAYGSVVTSSTAAFAKGSATLDVVDATQFQDGDWVLITNYGVGHIIKIDQVLSATQLQMETSPTCANTIAFPSGDTAYARGALVVRVLDATFFVQNLDGVPTLWMDPDSSGADPAEPLAEGIEDFQVELGVDPVGDGVFEDGAAGDDDEWSGNHPLDSALLPSAVVRAVRMTLVARSVSPLSGVPSATFIRPAAGNRAVATAADQFRRRTLRSVIEVRNLGASP